MEGFDSKNLNVESNVELEGHDMQIEAEDMSFVFDIIFNQMYRDPIGSVIREITSNCFDSHVEAGVTDAVVIAFGQDDAGEFITFQDFGIGISPERMQNIYSKPAKSTKRGSKEQIGYWGLGSKSPLAYDDSFILITVSGGIKYEYVVHKGENSPRIDKIDEYPTEERNGSIVKIYMKDDDKWKFRKKLNEQLQYFDNVFVKNCYSFQNSYKIYEGKYWKLRNDTDSTTLHLAIGRVTYPIDWGKLGMEPIKVPFALKFNIGELPITPERESVRYVTVKKDGVEVNAIDIIKKRIEDFKAEILELAADFPFEHNNLVDYEKYKEEKPYITIGEDAFVRRIDISNLVEDREHVYTPFVEIGLEEFPVNPYAQYNLHSYIKIKRVEFNYGKRLIQRNFEEAIIVRDFNNVGSIKQMVLDYLKHKAREQGLNSVYFIRKRSLSAREIKELLKFDAQNVHKQDYANRVNWITTWKRFNAIMKKEVIMQSIALEDVVVPEDFATRWKENNKLKRNIVEWDEETEIPLDDVRVNPKSSRRRAVLVDSLKNRVGFIIYGYAEDEEALEFYAALFATGLYRDSAYIYKIRTKDAKIFLKIPNAIYVHHFMNDHPIFRKVAAALIVTGSPIWQRKFHHDSNNRTADLQNPLVGKIFTPLQEAANQLGAFSRQTVNISVGHSGINEKMKQEIIDIATTNGWIDPEIQKNLDRIDRYTKDLKLMPYLVLTEESVPYVAEYFHLKGKKVNEIWVSPEPWQLELLKELQAKFKYNQEVVNLAASRTPYSNFPQKKRNAVDGSAANIKEINLILSYHEQKTAVLAENAPSRA